MWGFFEFGKQILYVFVTVIAIIAVTAGSWSRVPMEFFLYLNNFITFKFLLFCEHSVNIRRARRTFALSFVCRLARPNYPSHDIPFQHGFPGVPISIPYPIFSIRIPTFGFHSYVPFPIPTGLAEQVPGVVTESQRPRDKSSAQACRSPLTYHSINDIV